MARKTTTEVAKMLRKELKRTFPKQKFSVRSGGGSTSSAIHVAWKNGVPETKVEPILTKYKDIDYDPFTGEILKGGNRYVFGERKIAPEKRERVKKKIAKRFGKSEKDVEFDYRLRRRVHRKLKEMHL